MGYIRDVYSDGSWFSIQGSKKNVEKLAETEINKLCQQTLNEGVYTDKKLCVKVSKSGRRNYIHEPHGPFPAQEIGGCFKKFTTIKALFLRFVSFITGGSRSREQELRLQMSFTMQLFKSEDDELLEQLFPSDSARSSTGISDLPFSKVLHHWVEALRGIGPEDGKLHPLRQLIEYQKAIEEICTTKRPKKRAQLRKKLNEKIVKAIKDAQEGTSIYIPGGIYEARASLPMVYEIKKEGEELLVNVFDITGRLLKTQEKERSSNRSIKQNQMLVAAGEKEESSLLFCAQMRLKKSSDEIGTFVDISTLLLSGNETEEDLTEMVMKAPERNILQKSIKDKITRSLFGTDEWEAYVNNRNLNRESELKKLLVDGEESISPAHFRDSRNSPGDYTKAFLRTIDEAAYRSNKVRIRAKALFAIWDNAGKMIVDPHFRSWLSENAITLIKGIDKGFPAAEGAQIRKGLEGIVKEIDLYDAHQRIQIGDVKKSGTTFDEPLRPTTPFIPTKKVSWSSIRSDSVEKPPEIEKILEKKDLTALEKHITALKKLTDKKKFSLVHFYVKEAFLGLERCTETQMREIANSDDFDKWLDAIQELSFLLPRVSFGIKRLSPSSGDIKMYLQAVRLQDQLIRERKQLVDDPYVQGFAFDMDFVKSMLSSPYIQLGDDAKEIYEHIAYFTNLEKRPFRGYSSIPSTLLQFPHEIKDHGGNELNDSYLYSSYQISNISHAFADIGQKGLKSGLPQHIINLRKSYCLLSAFFAPQKTLFPYTMRQFGGKYFTAFTEGEFPSGLLNYVEKQLTSRSGEISFSFSRSLFFRNNTFIIEPWDLALEGSHRKDERESFNDFIEQSKHSSNRGDHFNLNGIPLQDSLFQNSCFEQVITSEPSFLSESGRYITFFDGDSNDQYEFKGKTEWQILQGQKQIFGLPPQTFQQLQLMQVHRSPNSIIENTLAFLSQNQELLDQEKYGFQVARLIERNFLRSGVFCNKSLEEQRFIFNQIAQQLKTAQFVGNHFALLHLFEIARKIYVNAKEGAIEKREFDLLVSILKGQEQSFKEKGLSREYMGEQLALCAMMEEPPPIEEFLPLYFQYVSAPVLFERKDPIREERVQELFLKRISDLKGKLKRDDERAVLCNAVCKALGFDVSSGKWSAIGSSGLLFSQGVYKVDFSRCEVWENNVRKAQLPSTVTAAHLFPTIERMIRQEDPEVKVKNLLWDVRSVRLSATEAFQYESTVGGRSFRLILGSDATVRLYRKGTDNRWFMYQEELFSESPSEKKAVDCLPRTALAGDRWIRDDARRLVIEKEGKERWRANLSGDKEFCIRFLERIDDRRVALNFSGRKEAKRFFDLEDRAYVTALGKKRVLDRVEYGRFNYTLQREGNKWSWVKYPGYTLSDHSLESYAQLPKYTEDVSENRGVREGLARIEKLFHPSFTNYHLLEHDKMPPKLVMPGVRFAKKGEQGETPYRCTPEWGVEDVDKIALYEFDVDPIKGLVPKVQPEGYLYLAYALAVQGNLKDALYYFQKSNIGRPFSSQGQEVFSWLEAELKSLPKESLEKNLLNACLFLFKPQVLGLKIDPFAKEGLIRALQAKRNYDALCAVEGGGNTQAAAELRQIANGSWASVMYEISKDPGKSDLIHRALSLLDIVFEPRDAVQGLIGAFDCSELTKRCLREFAARMPAEPDEAFDFDRIQTLYLLEEWRKFDEQVLKPFEIGPQEIKVLRDEGGFEKLKKIREETNLFTSEAEKYLADLSKIREVFSLKTRIEELEKVLKDRKKGSVDRIPGEERTVSLFSSDEKAIWERCFSEQPEGMSVSAFTVADVKQPEVGETSKYANELNAELHLDLCSFVADSPKFSPEVKDAAARSIGKTISGKRVPQQVVSNAGALSDMLVGVEKKKTKEAQIARQRCLDFLQPQTRRSLLDRFKRVGRPTPDMLFDTAVRCYGEGIWERLFTLLENDAKIDVNALKHDIDAFLKTSIQAKQIQTAQVLVKGLPQDRADPKFAQTSNEIFALLNSEWHYDVDEDPLAPTLLLIEYELGFTCRPSQLLVVRENLVKENQFKQEICGGGKTTVLRNIISQFRADGKTLSGVSTLEPLRAEHGMLLARTTKNAYEEQVLNFCFDRASLTDELSLRRLYRDLLETTVNRGRIDLTKGDLQSFKLSMLLKHDEIARLRREYRGIESKREVEQIHRELDVMEDIRDFLYKNASIMADELDKDCDPTQEKNYAHGNIEEIAEEERSAACLILRTMCFGESENLRELAKAFIENRQSRLDEKIRDEAMKELSANLYDHFKVELSAVDREAFVSYLTAPNSNEAESVYRTLFEGKEISSQLKEIAFCRRMLSEVIPHALKKRAGISYGRSKRDGVSVIPYVGSDKPREGSMHANETERVWYTCADYLQNGVSKSQARALWVQAKQRAVKQAIVASAEDPSKTVFLDDMPAAIEFAEKFLTFGEKPLTLSQVQESHVDEIVAKVNGGAARKIDFIEATILPSLRQEEEKIVSDAQDLPHMVKSYSGSSGTDTGMYALPDKVVIEGARQEGVHGRVIAALKESEKKLGQDSFLSYADSGELLRVLTEQMKGGDCLVDVGRFFPGVAPKDIARAMSEGARQNGVEYIVFADSEDRWRMLRTKDNEEVSYQSSKDVKKEDLKKRITIFDDVRTRGAERDSTEGVTEFVTIDVDTDWSGFEQGVARERNLLNGKADIRYILSPQLKNRLGDNPSLDLLQREVLTKNEAERLQQLNYKAELQRIRHILRRTGERAFREMSSEERKVFSSKHHCVREYLFTLERELFFCKNGIDVHLAACPQKKLSSSSVLDSVVSRQLQMLDAMEREVEKGEGAGRAFMKVAVEVLEEARPFLWSKYSEEARKKVPKELAAKVKELFDSGKGRVPSKYLPSTVSGGSSSLDDEVETEQEIEIEQEQEQEQEAVSLQEEAVEKEIFTRVSLHISYSKGKGPAIEESHRLDKFFPFDQKGRVCTENCFPISRSGGKICPWGMKDGEILLPLAHKRIDRSLFVIEEGRVKEFWGDQLDLDEEFVKIAKGKDTPYRAFIFNYGLGTSDTGCSVGSFDEEIQHKIMEYIVSTKLHRGDTDFVKGKTVLTNFYDPLVRFLKAQNDLDLLEKGVRAAIAKYRPDVAYKGSSLSRAFREARD